MEIGKQLSAVFACVAPGGLELPPGGLALDDEERVFSGLVRRTHPDVSTRRLFVVAELPSRLKFNVLWLVALGKKTTDALEYDEVFRLGEIGRGGCGDGNASFLIAKLADCTVNAQLDASRKHAPPCAAHHILGKFKRDQQVVHIASRHHLGSSLQNSTSSLK